MARSREKFASLLRIFAPWTIKAANIVLFQVLNLTCKVKNFQMTKIAAEKNFTTHQGCRENYTG